MYWLSKVVPAILITSAGVLFGWVLTSNLLAAFGIGIVWYLLTRLYRVVNDRCAMTADDVEARRLWRELFSILREHRDGDVLVTDDNTTILTVHKMRFRGYERAPMPDAGSPTDTIELFFVDRDGSGFVTRDVKPVATSAALSVVTDPGRVTVTELRELVDQLRRSSLRLRD